MSEPKFERLVTVALADAMLLMIKAHRREFRAALGLPERGRFDGERCVRAIVEEALAGLK